MRDIRVLAERNLALVPKTRCRTCFKPTRGGKDYCSTHFDSNPYAAKVMGEWENLQKEKDLLDRGIVKRTSPWIPETLSMLRNHPCNVSIPQLARLMDFEVPTMHRLVRHLERRKLVKTYQNRRGTLFVELL